MHIHLLQSLETRRDVVLAATEFTGQAHYREYSSEIGEVTGHDPLLQFRMDKVGIFRRCRDAVLLELIHVVDDRLQDDPVGDPIFVVHLRTELREVRQLGVIPLLHETAAHPLRPQIFDDFDHVEHVATAGRDGLLQKFGGRARRPFELAAERFEFRSGHFDDPVTPSARERRHGQGDAIETLLGDRTTRRKYAKGKHRRPQKAQRTG